VLCDRAIRQAVRHYRIGLELLILNGLLVFAGLLLISKKHVLSIANNAITGVLMSQSPFSMSVTASPFSGARWTPAAVRSST
jgi:hypothetical protein